MQFTYEVGVTMTSSAVFNISGHSRVGSEAAAGSGLGEHSMVCKHKRNPFGMQDTAVVIYTCQVHCARQPSPSLGGRCKLGGESEKEHSH